MTRPVVDHRCLGHGALTAAIGRTSGTLRRRFTRAGDLVAAAFPIGVVVRDWMVRVLPARVAAVSAFILRSERSRLAARP